MSFKKFVILIILSGFFLNGCATTKYIPKSYFEKRHAIKVKVKPLPAPSHIEKKDKSDEDFLSNLVGSAIKSERAANLRATFGHIDNDRIRLDLQESIGKKIKNYYDVVPECRDLVVEVEITSWGWILPTGSYGLRLGSYQLQFSGKVRVYDASIEYKEIAFTSLQTQEEMRDQMSQSETSRRVNRAVDELAELTAEFLWRSDDKS